MVLVWDPPEETPEEDSKLVAFWGGHEHTGKEERREKRRSQLIKSVLSRRLH